MARRKSGSLGICGCFLRIMLAILNLFIFGIGLALVVLTSLFKWSTVFDFVKKIDGLEQFVNFQTLDGVIIALLVIGIYLVILSLIGFIAVTSMNRCFLGMYEVLLLIIFLAHLGALIALLVLQPKYEETIRGEFDNIIARITNATLSGLSDTRVEAVYTSLRALSGTFNCCGIRGPDDFDAAIRDKVCQNSAQTKGCGNELIDVLHRYGIYIFVIPSAVVLFFELILLGFIPYLFYKASKRN